MEIDVIIEKLREIEIFSDFAESTQKNIDTLKEVALFLKKEKFSDGDIIFKKEDIAKGLYILLEGSVQVIRSTIQGEPFAVYNLSADDNVFFGQKGLVTKEERSATVKSINECSVLFLSTEDFYALCEKEPVFGYKTMYRIAKNLAKYLKESTKDMLTLYQALIDEIDEA